MFNSIEANPDAAYLSDVTEGRQHESPLAKRDNPTEKGSLNISVTDIDNARGKPQKVMLTVPASVSSSPTAMETLTQTLGKVFGSDNIKIEEPKVSTVTSNITQ